MPSRLLNLLLVAFLLATTCAEVHAADEPPRIVSIQLGLGDHFKLGCWAPLRVTVEGGTQPLTVSVVAQAPDSDGLRVATTTPLGKPIGTEPGQLTEAMLYVRVGKVEPYIQVQLLGARRVLDRKTAHVYSDDKPLTLAPATHATDKLFVEIGGDLGMEPLVEELVVEGYRQTSATGQVDDPAALPRDWIGYEGVNAVLLTTGKTQWWRTLSSSDPRMIALKQWVEAGGKLVVSCGADGAEALAPGGPLAELIPGEFVALESLAKADAIERFADSPDETPAINLEGGTLPVTRLKNVKGQILAHEGRNAQEFPLVVRSPFGFGEVVFIGVDLKHPSINGWPGSKELLRQLLGRMVDRVDSSDDNRFRSYGNDSCLSKLLRQLDVTFTDVTSVSFLTVVVLVLAYLLLIGPGDYFLARRFLGRPESTWITFPLIVILTSAGAYVLAYWLKGEGMRLNQVEFVDVDTESGLARGTVITHLFSPRAQRFNFTLEPRSLAGDSISTETKYTSWLGNPGYGINGMQSTSQQSLLGRADYTHDPTPLLSQAISSDTESVRGMPVQVWSTKTPFARWTGRVDRSIEADLLPSGDGLVEGNITNDTGVELSECHLLYGDWAWKLGLFKNGQSKSIDTSLKPIRVNTLAKQILSEGDGNSSNNEKDMLRNLRWRDTSIEALSILFSVRDSVKGIGDIYDPAQLGYAQLGHHLELGNALLIGSYRDGPCCEIHRDGESLAGEKDKYHVFCRFILDVEPE